MLKKWLTGRKCQYEIQRTGVDYGGVMRDFGVS